MGLHYERDDSCVAVLQCLRDAKEDPVSLSKLDADVDAHLVSRGATYYVTEYRRSGQYFDIDYPGGIEQLVTDYEAGKIFCF